jgi:predicted nucleic acid-binding protein
MILCDTNIFIEFYKKNDNIIRALHGIGKENIAISVITEAELLYGALNSQEFRKLKKHLAMCKNYPLTIEISAVFIELMNRYALSHRPSIPDLLIAATAIVNNLELFTLNMKDFRFIPEVKLYSCD